MNTRLFALVMPRWGMTMTEGVVAGWLAELGAVIQAGDPLLEIETSKITNEVESPVAGALRYRVDAGTTAAVGQLIGVLADPAVTEEEIHRFVAAHEGAVAAQRDPSPPGTRLLDLGPHALNVLDTGSGDGVPIVLVHGFGGELATWMFNQPALASQRRVVAIDLPAHGGSTAVLDDASPTGIADLLGAALDALQVGRALVVGHSFGGAVATLLAARRPERVAGLALVAPVGLGTAIDASYVEDFISAARRRQMKDVLGRLFADPERISNAMVEQALRCKRMDGATEALRRIARGFLQDGRQALDLRAAVAGLAAPRLALWGDQDRTVPPPADLPPGVMRASIAGAAHMPHMEQADDVNRRLSGFAAQVDG